MMKQLDVEHHSFDVVRLYPVPPARVFEVWSNPALKRRWFAETDGWTTQEYHLDFREGGGEYLDMRSPDGIQVVYRATLRDIAPDRRIVYAYEMTAGAMRASVSLACVTFEPEPGDATRIVIVEHHTLLDGHDDVASRQAGVESMLEKLANQLARTRGLA